MCNLYILKVTRAELIAYFEANDTFRREIEKDYVSPGRPGLVVKAEEDPEAGVMVTKPPVSC